KRYIVLQKERSRCVIGLLRLRANCVKSLLLRNPCARDNPRNHLSGSEEGVSPLVSHVYERVILCLFGRQSDRFFFPRGIFRASVFGAVKTSACIFAPLQNTRIPATPHRFYLVPKQWTAERPGGLQSPEQDRCTSLNEFFMSA
ncbi:hypothetical protein ALC60_14689, partial [Trachymyrmex zeteki]